MKRFVAGVSLVALVGLASFGGAAYAVDEHAPHGNETSHPHHVHTGSGCEDIDEVRFEADHLGGMHRAAIESGNTRGPWHGTCATHIHP